MATIRTPAMAVQFAGKVSKFEDIERVIRQAVAGSKSYRAAPSPMVYFGSADQMGACLGNGPDCRRKQRNWSRDG